MHFAENKYLRWYFNIIYKAEDVRTKGKTEFHHVLPESLHPEYKNLNKYSQDGVHLTARGHFICQWLLTKMATTKKHRYQMWDAFTCMLYRENRHQERYKVSQTLHKQKSIKFTGEGNPVYGKTHNANAKKKISETHLGSTKKKISDLHKGKLKSEKHKKALAKTKDAGSGTNATFYRDKHSLVTKEKIRRSILNLSKKLCPDCIKQHTPGNYTGWHGDNCKMKETV